MCSRGNGWSICSVSYTHLDVYKRQDFYQLLISHISQHLTADADVLKVYKAAADMAKELMEWVLYIEVPKH